MASETAAGDRIELFPRLASTIGDQPSPQGWEATGGPDMTPRRTTCELHGMVRFSLDFQANSFNPGQLFSTGDDNPDGVSHMLALLARTGGTWVDEGENTGHWEGGVADGTYLLCWEDAVQGDNDFQDLVVYASGIRPARG